MVPRIGWISHLLLLLFYELLFYKSCHLSLSLHMCACARECTRLSLCMTWHTCTQYLDCVHNVYKCIYTNCHGIKVSFFLTDEMQLLFLTNIYFMAGWTSWRWEWKQSNSTVGHKWICWQLRIVPSIYPMHQLSLISYKSCCKWNPA